MTTQKFNENRTFGIEIEFTTADRAVVARLMREKGLLASVEGYNHTTKNHWKLITDSSCGYELVSPILKGRDGLRQLKLATEALKEAGAKVDKRCGLHIHHDINDMDARQIANIYALYIKLEKTIDGFMPISRRANNNTFCRSIYNHYNNQQQLLNKLKEVNTITDIQSLFTTRYLKLNIQSYIKYGTLEFRQHSGTIEYDKMYNWILLSQQMVEAGKSPVQKIYNEATDTIQSLRNKLGLIAALGADEEIVNMLKWYRDRAKELAVA